MWKINFYLLPAQEYAKIKIEDLLELENVFQNVKKDDFAWVPNEFYDVVDKNGQTAVDYLYGAEENDLNAFLRDIVTKQSVCDDNYNDIAQKDEMGYIAFGSDTVEEEKQAICVQYVGISENKNDNDILKVKRNYIKKVRSYKQYVERIGFCFPDLYFHENAFEHIEKLGHFNNIVNELQRHLIVLNDYGKSIYNMCDKEEKMALSRLESEYHIVCSGKGSNENVSYKITINGMKITCNPHTKFFDGHNDQRIYFCWGRDEIRDHAIIIARIGNHWT